MTETIKIPLFPLGVVLLPDMLLPLHIFEGRYKQMISECLADDKPFGIVFFDGHNMRAVGCMARVIDVMKRYDDGRMDIMTRGGERFVIHELMEDKTYMEARVTFFDDAEDTSDDDLKGVVETAWKLLKEMAHIDAGFDPSNLGDHVQPKRLSFALSALEGFTPAERQRFLEMTSASERLKRSVQALDRIVQRNQLTQEIHRMIGGNGHPPKNILRQLEDPSAK